MEFLAITLSVLALGLVFVVTFTGLMQVLHFLPYAPTPMPVVREMVRLAKLKKGEQVYDLGAGDGRLVIEAKRQCRGVTATGYEIGLALWMIAKIKILFSCTGARMRCRNFLTKDLSDADVVFLYVTHGYMKRLTAKFSRELKPGTRIIAYAFPFADLKPVSAKRIAMGKKKSLPIFVYSWPKSAAKRNGGKRKRTKK